MCGIAGIVRREGSPSLAELKPMLDRITHRGPDDWGHHISGPLAFGMRRLSIIDLSSGHQPISNEDGSVWTVFNGEIYNFLELRPRLEAKGHVFSTNTDTEVIVHLWEEYGSELVQHLRGMFALAVWDERTRTLFVARDRLGIKPLYYHLGSTGLLFGSELKTLLAHPDISRDIDYEALLRIPRTGLYLRTAQHSQRRRQTSSGPLCHLCRRQGEPRRILDAPPNPVVRSEHDYLEELNATLEEAVRIRLVADVPLGAFLSGGIDSSTVVALMARQMRTPVKSFSIGFDYQDFDELKYARRIAEHFKTEHHEEVVRPDALSLLPRLVWHYDEPFADSSAIPTYYVSRMARKHVTVTLSGDGGDELFGGYERYLLWSGLDRFDRLSGSLRGVFGRVFRMLPFPLRHRAVFDRMTMDFPEAYRDWISTFPRIWQQEFAPTGPLSGARPNPSGWREWWDRAANTSRVGRLLYTDLKAYLPDDILTKVDRASMAVSLEARVPILDHKVVELAARMPMDMKIRNGGGKYLLKRLIEPWMPEGFLSRPKMGFAVPLVSWFRNELKDYVRDVLLSSKARERGLFDMKQVERLIDIHQRGSTDVSPQLWSLLFLEEWFRQFIDGDASDVPPAE